MVVARGGGQALHFSNAKSLSQQPLYVLALGVRSGRKALFALLTAKLSVRAKV